MSEWPKLYHRAGNAPDGTYIVDDRTAMPGYQVTPPTWEKCAAWCGGTQVMYPDGGRGVAVGGSLAPENVALLGDFVMRVGPDRYEVSRADGHYQRWAESEGT